MPTPFGGGIKAILERAGVPSKSGLTIGSAALNKLDKKSQKGGTAASRKSMTGKSYGTGSKRTGSRSSKKSQQEDFEAMDLDEVDNLIH